MEEVLNFLELHNVKTILVLEKMAQKPGIALMAHTVFQTH